MQRPGINLRQAGCMQGKRKITGGLVAWWSSQFSSFRTASCSGSLIISVLSIDGMPVIVECNCREFLEYQITLNADTNRKRFEMKWLIF